MIDVGTAAARLAQLASFYDADPRPPASPRRVHRTLLEIRRAIRPFALPGELEDFWLGWDPLSFDKLLPFPSLIDPGTALALWRYQRYPIGDVPAVLFPIASQRFCLLHVELIHPGWVGPRVWFHSVIDDEYEVQAATFADYLVQAADGIVNDLVELPHDGRPFLGTGAADEWDQLVGRSLDAAGVAHDERGPQDWRTPAGWPRRFRQAQGIEVTSR
jgi:hypothetical protein